MESLAVTEIGQSYDGEAALRDVSFSIARGTVLAVCGENGTGKLTLMKMLGRDKARQRRAIARPVGVVFARAVRQDRAHRGLP